MKNLTLTDNNLQNMELFRELLKKDDDTIINEALKEYFANAQKALVEKQIADENALTNLSYDEFWDDLEL